MGVIFKDRSHSDFIPPMGVTFSPLKHSWADQGGPQFATIEATGNPHALWRLLDWLRYDVTITDRNDSPVWWGQVETIIVNAGAISFGVSLENMHNKIAALWNTDDTGGITAWSSDTDSVSTYGTKELLIPAPDTPESAAEQKRDWELAQRKWPHGVLDIGDGAEASVILECAGWFYTLGWTYYDRDEGLEENALAGGVGQKVGWGFSSTEIAFTSRGRRLSELNSKLNNLEKGEKIAVTNTSSNNVTLTVESSSQKERETVTATSIAFLHEIRNATGEYIRARHGIARKLNNYNLESSETTTIGTLSATANATDTSLTLSAVSGLESGSRVWIELDGGGYHKTYVSGEPDSSAGTITIRDEMPSTATSGNDVLRANRWVTNETGDVYYTETTDYTFDAAGGKITVVSTGSGGSIANNQVLKVSYRYTEYRIEDSNLGFTFISANDVIRVTGSSSNNGFFRVLSGTTDGDRITVKESVTVEDPGNSVTVARGSNMDVEENITSELPDGSTSETIIAYGDRVVQSFQISSDEAWTVNQIQVRARKVGSPADSLRVGIRSDSSGPSTLLEYVDIPADDLSTQLSWVTGQMLNTLSLSTSTTYWVSVGRSSSRDATNYYEVAVDEDLGYTSGALKVYDGAAYQDRPTNADLVFRLLGSEVTTTQITELIDQEGQFFEGHDIIDASGVSICQYRDGRTTALDELLDLLNLGTTNDRRLLATVTRERYLRVEEEPTEPTVTDYLLQSNGVVTTALGQRLTDGDCSFVGDWIALKDIIPGTAAISHIAKPTPFFCQMAEYDHTTRRYRVQPRNGPDIWTFGEIGAG